MTPNNEDKQIEVQHPTGEFRKYIKVEGRWRHVYIVSTHFQTRMFEPPVKMVEYKLTKNSKTIYTAERSHFQDVKPRKPKNFSEMG